MSHKVYPQKKPPSWSGVLGFFAALGLWWSPPSSAACPANAEWVRTDATQALTAYGAGDLIAFGQSVAALAEDIGCLTEAVPKNDIERVHLVMALKAITEDDQPAAVGAFRSVLAHNPAYQPDDAVAPLESPARTAYDEAKGLGPGPSAAIPPQGSYTWTVDGEAGAGLPTVRASMVMLQDGSGTVVQSRYLPNGETPDALVGAAPIQLGAVILPGKRKSAELSGQKPVSRQIAMGAGGAGVLSGIALISAAVIKGQYLNAPAEDGLLENQLGTNRTLGYTGYALAGVTVGLGATAVVVGRW